jgi:cobalt-zinc-cadmium efflux system outer membrane protein
MRTVLGLALTGMLVGSSAIYAQNREPLAALLAEAQKNNPDLQAAEHAWRAAAHVKDEVTPLTNPQFTLQVFGVGKPFAGFNSSDFAYIGIGASQELPYPGKRRLKGEAADAAANEQQTHIGVLAVSIAEQIKIAYFRLAFLQQTLTLLEASRTTLTQIIDGQLVRYAAGRGSQTEPLEAQLERTKLVREITMHHQEVAQTEADLKHLLHRRQDSPDIVADELRPTALHYSSRELLDFVRTQNPEIRMNGSSVAKQNAQLKSVERESKPDFSIGFMYERTGLDFPAYYMLTFGVSLPRRSRVRAEVAEAGESLAAAKDRLDAALQQQLSETQKQYTTEVSTAELLAEYRDGLIPQADAVFRAGVAAYPSNQQTVASVLTSFNEGLELKRGYYQTLLDHEIAIAHLQRLTGKELR